MEFDELHKLIIKLLQLKPKTIEIITKDNSFIKAKGEDCYILEPLLYMCHAYLNNPTTEKKLCNEELIISLEDITYINGDFDVSEVRK